MTALQVITPQEVIDGNPGRNDDGTFADGNKLGQSWNGPTLVRWLNLLKNETSDELHRIARLKGLGKDPITGTKHTHLRRSAALWLLRMSRSRAKVEDFDSIADRTDGKPVPILPVGENGCAAIVFQVLAPTYSDTLMNTDTSRDNTPLLLENEPSVCAMCGRPLFAASEPMEVPANVMPLACGAD